MACHLCQSNCHDDVGALTLAVSLVRVVSCLEAFSSLASPALIAMKECLLWDYMNSSLFSSCSQHSVWNEMTLQIVDVFHLRQSLILCILSAQSCSAHNWHFVLLELLTLFCFLEPPFLDSFLADSLYRQWNFSLEAVLFIQQLVPSYQTTNQFWIGTVSFFR